MDLQTIFEIIRREQAVLWVGSGFSLYAGYPTGRQLADMVYQAMSLEEREEISKNLSLDGITEEFVRLKGGNRKPLENLLKKIFSKAPTEKKWHQLLSKIPHISTIITTNYDKLFEHSYRDEIHPIVFPIDVAHRDGRVELFKVHGDVHHPDTMVITKSDYSDFYYNRQSQNLIWSVIKERISNKHVVFIGYDLEDENIKIVLREVASSLGSARKDMYLIAPALKRHKIEYLASLGITYVDFKGEAFVDKLYRSIADKITDDFAKKNVSVPTLQKFFSKNNLSINLSGDKEGFRISGVNNPDKIPGKLSFKYKPNAQFPQSLQAVIEGKSFDEVVINGSELNSLKLLMNEVNIVDDNIADIRLKVSATPKMRGSCSIIFDDGSEFEAIEYLVFTSKDLMQLVGKFKNLELSVKVNANSFASSKEELSGAIAYKLVTSFKTVNEAIAVSKFCLSIAQGLGFTIFFESSKRGQHLQVGKVGFPLENLRENLDFFESLKKIEKFYGIRFSDFDVYSEHDFNNAYWAVLAADNGFHVQHWDEELKWDLDLGATLELLQTLENGTQLVVEKTEPELIKILGHEIVIGYQVAEPLDLEIINLEEVKNGASVVKIKSKSKKIRLSYKRELVSS